MKKGKAMKQIWEEEANKAMCAIKNKEWAKAEMHLKKVIRFSDVPISVGYNLAKVLGYQNKDKQAQKILENILAKEPGYFNACYECGICFLKQRQFVNSFEMFQKALVIRETDVDSQVMVARLAQRIGKYEKAKQYWQILMSNHKYKKEACLGLMRTRLELKENNALDDLINLYKNEIEIWPLLKMATRSSTGAIPIKLHQAR